MILQDKQQIDELVNPHLFFVSINKWLELSREDKQRIFAKYIDFIELEKKEGVLCIANGYFRESYLKDMRENHIKYNTPINLNLFVDDYGLPLSLNSEIKTSEEAKKYFKKLSKVLGSDYRLNYYEVDTDEDLKDISFSSEVKIEKIIRLIALDNKEKYKKNGNLKLAVITIDLSNVIAPNGQQVYKGFFEKIRKVLEEHELCDIQK